jgi:type IV pilus assembly protein PilO
MFNLQKFTAFASRLSKREKLIVYFAIFFASLTVLDRFIINPISHKIKSLDNEIKEKELSIQSNSRILAQKDRILAEANKYSSFLSGNLSEEEEITSLLKEIEAFASKSSVYLVDIKPASIKNIGSLKKYFINLNCEAQVEQLAEFMYNIESSNKLLTIERYEISPRSKDSSIAKCSMVISKIAMQ